MMKLGISCQWLDKIQPRVIASHGIKEPKRKQPIRTDKPWDPFSVINPLEQLRAIKIPLTIISSIKQVRRGIAEHYRSATTL
jgi:hypothetical protein